MWEASIVQVWTASISAAISATIWIVNGSLFSIAMERQLMQRSMMPGITLSVCIHDA